MPLDRKGSLVKDNEQEAIRLLRKIKDENDYTLSELSRKLNFQVTTIERWLKTNRINKLYAEVVTLRLKNL